MFWFFCVLDLWKDADCAPAVCGVQKKIFCVHYRLRVLKVASRVDRIELKMEEESELRIEEEFQWN